MLQTGDRIRIDLNTRKVDVLLPAGELAARRAAWTPPKLPSMTPWEEIYRSMVGQLGTGACLEPATLFLNVIETARRIAQQPLTERNLCRSEAVFQPIAQAARKLYAPTA